MKKRFYSTTQILILIIGIFAIAYALGGEVGVVSGNGDEGYDGVGSDMPNIAPGVYKIIYKKGFGLYIQGGMITQKTKITNEYLKNYLESKNIINSNNIEKSDWYPRGSELQLDINQEQGKMLTKYFEKHSLEVLNTEASVLAERASNLAEESKVLDRIQNTYINDDTKLENRILGVESQEILKSPSTTELPVYGGVTGGFGANNVFGELEKNQFEYQGDTYSNSGEILFKRNSNGWKQISELPEVEIPQADFTDENINSELGVSASSRITERNRYLEANKRLKDGKSYGDYNGKEWVKNEDGQWIEYKVSISSKLLDTGWILVKNAGYAAGIYGLTRWVTGLAGGNEELVDSLSLSLAGGFFAGKTALDLFGSEGGIWAEWLGPWAGVGIGLGVSIGIFLLTYKKTDQEVVIFECMPWDANTGGENCELCNKQGMLPCSEYQCRSLGQSCELINKGTTEERCAWVNRNDIEAPIIKPDSNVLDAGHKYVPDNSISPPDRGVEIVSQEKCLEAFDPFSFGIGLNEPAKCKFDDVRRDSFDEMRFFFSNGISRYNHSRIISQPSFESLEAENITLENGGNFEIFVRCQDSNKNTNTANFVFKYCVDDGPDATPPRIIGTNLFPDEDGVFPVAYNQSSIGLELYTNEPAECRWTRGTDKGFGTMEGTMECDKNVFEMNAQMLYKCSTELSGFEKIKENKFFFRCKDKPLASEGRNVNREGFPLTILSTRPLLIDEVGPSGVVKGASETVEVVLTAETSAGYDRGFATCYYSESCWKEGGSKDFYEKFYYEGEEEVAYSHEQKDLRVTEGFYECSIKCVDLAGNSDTKETNYTIETDTESPRIVRAYHDESYLRLTTNENAECVYGIKECSYEFVDANKVRTINGIEHFLDWDSEKTYYVKCKDDFGNEPFPDECSIVVSPSED